jgi:hypothetical protein
MKKNHVPRPRAIAATTQPIQTNARAARSLLRSEGMPIPDCLAGERLFHLLDADVVSRRIWRKLAASPVV